MGSTSQQSSSSTSSPSPSEETKIPKKSSVRSSPSLNEPSANPLRPRLPIQNKQDLTELDSGLTDNSGSKVDIEQKNSDLLRLLAERDKEITTLKTELENCKLALQQSISDCHFIRQQWMDRINASVSVENETPTTDNKRNTSKSIKSRRRNRHQSLTDIETVSVDNRDHPHIEDSDKPISKTEATIIKTSRKPVNTSGKLMVKHKPKIVFKPSTGTEDGECIELDKRKISELNNDDLGDDNDDLNDIISDVGEIDIDIGDKDNNERMGKVSRVCSDKVTKGTREGQNNRKLDEDEDVISDGLLTSLTDAAINNLSQLAALQERCESQKHQKQPQNTIGTPQSVLGGNSNSEITINRSTADNPLIVSGMLPNRLSNQTVMGEYSSSPLNPFSASSISNQAAIALNAAAAAAVASGVQRITPSGSLLSRQQDQQQQSSHHLGQHVSTSNSISSDSNVQADLSSTRSLASVVAAAALAAAAANADETTHNQRRDSIHGQQSRLISPAIPSPAITEFYNSLQQNPQIQNYHLTSSLHYPTSSTSVTPSSLLSHSVRRSLAGSNTTNASPTTMISPITSPNFLRRQFMPDRTMPIMSPSPSSGIATASPSCGGGSGTSTSLAHLLQHHHSQPQQRSASALANSSTMITPSPSTSTPISASGSNSAVSPMMSNKNSSQARLNNMQIRHKFGYLGSGRAQFNSPHGFCLGLNQEIVVADTNNHRICIFDKSGTYITQFGSPGKEDGQLWNPRKVAILYKLPISGAPSTSLPSSNNQLINSSNLQAHQTNLNQQQLTTYSSTQQHITSTNNEQLYNGGEPLYVVCDRGAERSRMQLFTKDGAFIKKIGIHYIDIVAGLAITQNGLIIVVDSVSPTVYIINGETGVLNGWFDCSGHMKEPSDIAVKSEVPGNEYFICDFKGHCVVVFSEQGEYLRKIGHDGLTSYPNGIDISDDGDILVGDSHGNRFHVVVFDRNGNFVSQFECPHVKVSRCCGLKITREGYIVTLAKNNHHVLVLDTIHI